MQQLFAEIGNFFKLHVIVIQKKSSIITVTHVIYKKFEIINSLTDYLLKNLHSKQICLKSKITFYAMKDLFDYSNFLFMVLQDMQLQIQCLR